MSVTMAATFLLTNSLASLKSSLVDRQHVKMCGRISIMTTVSTDETRLNMTATSAIWHASLSGMTTSGDRSLVPTISTMTDRLNGFATSLGSHKVQMGDHKIYIFIS